MVGKEELCHNAKPVLEKESVRVWIFLFSTHVRSCVVVALKYILFSFLLVILGARNCELKMGMAVSSEVGKIT